MRQIVLSLLTVFMACPAFAKIDMDNINCSADLNPGNSLYVNEAPNGVKVQCYSEK